MELKIKCEIDKEKKLYIELPLQCIKECSSLAFKSEPINKWLNDVNIRTQLTDIENIDLAYFCYDFSSSCTFEEAKKLPRKDLLRWTLHELCVSIVDEIADANLFEDEE